MTTTFAPPEFLKFAADPHSVTAQTAKRFGATPEQFVNWRWQMKHQVQTREDAAKILELKEREALGFDQTAEMFHAGISPYYFGLMAETAAEDCSMRLQVIPQTDELSDPIGIADPLNESAHSPVKEVVQAYPDRVAFCVAQLCPVYCRYCFRKRRDDEQGLHYNKQIIARGIEYIASRPAIRDVLITGGDPFIASDESIEDLLQRLRAIKHVEIIRFGTRTPVALPYRCTEKLASILKKYHPIWVNTHFNNAAELTPEAAQAIENLVNAGIPVGNQSVLLKGVNDTPAQMMDLLRGLLRMRVRPYYLFHPHRVAGTEHLRVPLSVGLDIMKSLRGQITGMGIPLYVVDTPSGKIPVLPNHVLGQDQQDLIFQDIRGDIWREQGIL